MRESMIEQYAELVIRIGVNIQPGQELVIGPASHPVSIECAPLVRKLVEKAYEAGASHVHVNWEDDQVRRLTMQHAQEDALIPFPEWKVKWMEEAVARNAAFLTVLAPNPTLMQGLDAAHVGKVERAKRMALANYGKATSTLSVSWCIISMPSAAWAKQVFPDLPEEAALDRMWDHVLQILRVDQPNPTQAWADHLVRLGEKTEALKKARFRKLHFKAPGTDLTIELPETHTWVSLANTRNAQGATFLPNMPSEEVFSVPAKTGVNGVVRSTLPLNYNGQLIENISLTFKDGRIVDFSADQGQEALQTLIETDEGSHYLGEVALVPVDSPISQLGVLFYNSLYDENASCHLAIGNGYPICVEGGAAMTRDQLLEAGVNQSVAHVDFMIGSSELDIDGITATGEVVPVFRKGNWANL